jgi:hypothetical protein
MTPKPIVSSSEHASARDEKASSLLPMLFSGLILVVVGGVVIMAFV